MTRQQHLFAFLNVIMAISDWLVISGVCRFKKVPQNATL